MPKTKEKFRMFILSHPNTVGMETTISNAMRVAIAASALLQLYAASVYADDDGQIQYLEPSVQRHAGVLPLSVCKQLIELGEKGKLVDLVTLTYNASLIHNAS